MKSYSLIPLTLIVLFFITTHASSCPNLINSTCLTVSEDDPYVDHYDFCITSLQAAPASHCATLNGLGTISIRLVGYNSTDTRCYIKQLMQSSKLDPYVKQCSHDCLEVFSNATSAVTKAMGYYKTKRLSPANNMLTPILTSVSNCEDCFKEKGVGSPLTKRNDDVFQLTYIALRVILIINQTESG